MSGKISSTLSVERLLGDELASAAERTLGEPGLGASDPLSAVHLPTAQCLLALYREVRHQGLAAPGDDTAPTDRRPPATDAFEARQQRRAGHTRPGGKGDLPREPVCAERRAVADRLDTSVQHPWDGEPQPAAGETSVAARADACASALAVRLATAQILLALYWELRHQRPDAPVAEGGGAAESGVAGTPGAGDDASLEWLSALLCAPPGLDHGPDHLAVLGGHGAPRAGLGLHHP